MADRVETPVRGFDWLIGEDLPAPPPVSEAEVVAARAAYLVYRRFGMIPPALDWRARHRSRLRGTMSEGAE